MTTLTDEELTVLIEAMDAWAVSDNFTNLFGDLMGGVLGKHSGVSKEDFESSMRSKMDDRKKNNQAKERQATLLKAKLINMQIEKVGVKSFKVVPLNDQIPKDTP